MDVMIVDRKGIRHERRDIALWAVPAVRRWLSQPVKDLELPHPTMFEGELLYWMFGSQIPRIYQY